MFLSLHRYVRRQRRRLVVLAAVLAISGAVIAAHSVIADDHLPDGAVMCLAVMQTAVAGLAAVGAARLARAATPVTRAPLIAAVFSEPVRPLRARAREGPPLLQVFRF